MATGSGVPHEEIVDLPTGTATITGMKVKTHHTNGPYAWASEQSRRLTPMWLHNDQIADNAPTVTRWRSSARNERHRVTLNAKGSTRQLLTFRI